MITTGFDKKVQIQQIIDNQLPEFVLSESPKAVDFLKQYYISQEYQGGPVDLTDNLTEYLKLDNFTDKIVNSGTTLSVGIGTADTTINVESTKGFPDKYGLFKVDNEIFTYTGITTNTFTGCERGFSGITTFHAPNNPGELVFTNSDSAAHAQNSVVHNLSALFLKEFYKKIKAQLTPGLEDTPFVTGLDAGNFIKEARSLYQAKGTEESFRILFNVLYGIDPKIVDLEQFLIKPSAAQFIRREIVLAEQISGNPNNLVGQTIKKSTDSGTQASVSEVEIITRGAKSYYKLGLFVGYNDQDLIQGTFTIPGKTKVIGPVSIGSSVITVDSTVGFGATGTVICGLNTAISYTDKTINQFLGCTNVGSAITTTSDLRSDEVYFGYEDGDLSKKTEIRITGVISKFVPVSDIKLTNEGEEIVVKNLGESILNPEINASKKEIIANSWIYNTASRYQIKEWTGSIYTLYSDVDKSSLKVGDNVDIVRRGEQNIVATGKIGNVPTSRTIRIDNFTLLPGISPLPETVNSEYDVRRQINKAKSIGVGIDYGDNILTTDVTNVYNDNDENLYVASNSLPSYDINVSLASTFIPTSTDMVVSGYLQDLDVNTLKYNTLSFPGAVPFITGDSVYYSSDSTPIVGLTTGTYYVKVLSQPNQIKIYPSRSFIIPDADGTEKNIQLLSASGNHTFTLTKQQNRKISAQGLLKKFPIETNIKSGKSTKTAPGATGMLVNGVEIANYKTDDNIFYGPLTQIDVLNGGTGYDVINLPDIVVSAADTISTGGIGNTAKIQPVVSGSVEDILIDPQDYDIDRVLSANISGGNGDGAVLEPVLTKRFRDVFFDARLSRNGGGVDLTDDTITFIGQHNLSDGQVLIYNSNGNSALSIGEVSNNANQNKFLQSGNKYWPKIVNSSTIKLYPTQSDYNAGINTVGFTSFTNTGTQKFRIYESKDTLYALKVINPGKGYTNRKLIVGETGISTITSTVNFQNHGFNDGDKILYSTPGTVISGLTAKTGITTTSNHYQIIKIDDHSFQLADAGIAATITSNYTRKNYIKFGSTGVGLQNFEYPPVELNLDIEYSGEVGIITAVPVVRGSIIDTYVYDGGTGYGSTVLNLERKPTITIKNGKDAALRPIITNNAIGIGTTSGSITAIDIQFGGREYSSAPTLEVVGDGIGAKLRATITDGKITDVTIINPGIDYTQDNTSIKVIAAGSNAILDSHVRKLTVNKFDGDTSGLLDSDRGIGYAYVGYSTITGSVEFGDTGADHSPIIGWAYDGNPIYGPHGHTDPSDRNSPIKILRSGYTNTSGILSDRPAGFNSGFFVEDYTFDNSGDLDENNGIFTKTPEFPQGVYAYIAGISSISSLPVFPYFIGDTYRSEPISDNFLINQNNFDFGSSSLIRNTFPYKVSDKYADNDYLIESNEAIEQISLVESVKKGSVDSFDIVEGGSGYAVGEVAKFTTNTGIGGGLNATVSTITGKSILNIQTSIDTYQNVVMVWDNPNQISGYISTSHTFLENDNLTISGVSTSIKSLTGTHSIGIVTDRTVITKDIAANATAGIITDIYVSHIPDNVSAGSSIGIGTENLLVLNTFDDNKVIRVRRGVVGAAHTASTLVKLTPSYFTLPVKSLYFESRVNDIVYFNPSQALGVGTIAGIGSTSPYTIGEVQFTASTPTQSIYLPNHPFKTNQKVIFTKGTSALQVSNTGATAFGIPMSGSDQILYVIKKSKDYIGVTTEVGLTTSTDGLFFHTKGSNEFGYSIKSDFSQVTAKVQKIDAKITLTTSHSMSNGDIVNIIANSDQSVGIGTSTAVKLKYKNETLLVNPVLFAASDVSSSTNKITIGAHGFKTGDKVFYSANTAIGNLSKDTAYFVYRVDDDNIQLAETHYDVSNFPPTVINFSSTGGSSQELALINPPIPVINNNDLIFDTSDSSLNGYNVKFFHDADFNNEFVSTGSTDSFSVVGVGTSSNLNYSSTNPSRVYYTLEKSGFISTADTEVPKNSQINYVDSTYTGNYSIFGVGSTTFSVSLPGIPEVLSYTQTDTENLKYTTTSPTDIGGVDSLKLNFGGFGYNQLPHFVSIASTQGINAEILPVSKNINRIGNVRIIDPGFEYSSDKTLRPEAFVPPKVSLINSYTIKSIDVTYGGTGYTNEPDLIIVDPTTGKQASTGILEAVMNGVTLNSVDIIEEPKGLTPIEQRIVAINNTNGVSVKSLSYDGTTGLTTCTLVTPITGFGVQPFNTGDKIFVEGLQSYVQGSGFNSEDYGYKFFTVSGYDSSGSNDKVEWNMTGIATGISTSIVGLAKTAQDGFGSIINFNSYPRFKSTQVPTKFLLGEDLLVLTNSQYTRVDLKVTESITNTIKVKGSYKLAVGEKILGALSGSIATVNEIVKNVARFDVDYSLRKDYGWSNDIGKLNEDFQVVPDNDYYQNLSYTVKSPITYDELVNPVNRLLHTSGLKNFADVGISSSVGVGSTANTNATTIVSDFIVENRVDTIHSFDMTKDVDILGTRSKFVEFKSKKLANYTLCKTNRVLTIDDISPLFSEAGTQYPYVDFSIEEGYSRFLVQVINPATNDIESTEFITFGDDESTFVLEKGSVSNSSEKLGILSTINNVDNRTIRFTPTDIYNDDLDLKVVKNSFNNDLPGIGTQSIGYVDLTGVNATVGIGSTAELISRATTAVESYFASIEVINKSTNEKNLVEVVVTHDGTNSYIAEYYTDTSEYIGYASPSIGIITSKLASNVLSLQFENPTSGSELLVRSKIVGFGVTSAGIGTYRFKQSGQSDGNERSLRYDAEYHNIAAANPSTNYSINTGISSDVCSTIKNIVRVSSGNTSAVHQFLTVHNKDTVHTTSYPILSIGSTGGLGYFTSDYASGKIKLYFKPDSEVNGQPLEIQRFSEVVYTLNDDLNAAPELTYGTVREGLSLFRFNALNGDRINKKDFPLKHNRVPIFEKIFNPSDTSVLDPVTGIFTIQDHFFATGEELVYTPNSTFIGIAGTAMQHASQTNLPTEVYAIRLTKDTFKLALTEANANSGTAVTFPSTGGGNAHELEMSKRSEKTLMSIDNVVQAPLAFTPVTTNLTNNGASISTSRTIFEVTGIATITTEDVIKIDNEYMQVTSVGLGTTALGPITNTGSANLIEVERGFVGTAPATHNHNATVRLYNGDFNIVGSTVYFASSPKGSSNTKKDNSNLDIVRSDFGGMVYLRNNYSKNVIFDDISEAFTGIGQTYRVSVGGGNTVGIETGSTLTLINGIFQKPSTDNNPDNNYSFIENSGISSITFTGVSSAVSGAQVISTSDVNQNNLPRGGVVVSVGSTGGLGIAPLVGAAVTVQINGSGGISTVGIATTGALNSFNWSYGSGYNTSTIAIGITDPAYAHTFISAAPGAVTGTGGPFTPTNATYVSETGVLTLTIPSHGRSSGNVQLVENSLTFTCSKDGHLTRHDYPRSTDPAGGNANLPITVVDANTISVNVGKAGGHTGTAAQITANIGAGGTITGFVINNAGSGYTKPKPIVPQPAYESLPVEGVFRRGLGNTTTTGIGLSVSLGMGPSIGIGSDNKFADAADLIEKNKLFIGDLAARRMKDKFTSYNYPSGFTEQDCIDDVVDVLEAVAYNLRYGGNDKTYDAANLFVNGVYSTPAPVTGEEQQVIYAFREAADMANRAIRNVDISAQVGAQYNHTFVSAPIAGGISIRDDGGVAIGSTTPTTATYDAETGDLVLTVPNNIYPVHAPSTHQPSTAQYFHTSGNLKLTLNNHGFHTGDLIKIKPNSLTFTCARDNHATEHTYPRRSDPKYDTWVSIASTTVNTFTVDVGIAAPNSQYAHTFVSATSDSIQKASNLVRITANSLRFTCDRDNNATNHDYPRTTDPVHNTNIAIAATSGNTFTVNVGVSDTALTTRTQVFDDTITVDPGNCANVQSAITTLVGIVTDVVLTHNAAQLPAKRTVSSLSLSDVKTFRITNPGYSFEVGDVIRPVGVVTDRSLTHIRDDFELEILEIFNDSYASWNLGEFDYIDTIKNLQNGRRTRFPLFYNGELLSFEIDELDPQSSLIDPKSLLMIYVNGILQIPGEAFTFEGGTSFVFTEAPDADDNIAIFFYKGTDDVDSLTVTDVVPTLKMGDSVQIFKHNGISTTVNQDVRTVYDIQSSDTIETNLYSKQGVDDVNYKPLSWIKQKIDRTINGDLVSKARDSIEGQVYPTARIIGDLKPTDDFVWIDQDARSLFKYENTTIKDGGLAAGISVDSAGGIIVDGSNPVAAGLTAIVATNGTISSLDITDGGSGYSGSVTVKIANPFSVGMTTTFVPDGTNTVTGIGSTATATLSLTNGVVTGSSIVNPGFGYSQAHPPQVIAQAPTFSTEIITTIGTFNGNSGIITGISTSVGIGTTLAVRFFVGGAYALTDNQPIYICDTTIGTGVTSIYTNDDDVVSTGTTFLNNVYLVSEFDTNAGVITCNVHSDSPVVGLSTQGTRPVGKFSWGKLSGFTRTGVPPIGLGVTGFTIGQSGLSTYPTIQRRGFGLRNNGPLRKSL